jgi:hypothetical protein
LTRDYEAQVDANKALRAERYSFEDVIYFLRRCKFDLSLIAKHPGASQQAQRPGAREQTGRPGVPSAAGARPEDFRVVYKDLYDLFQALKGKEPEFLQRQQLLEGFRIPQVNVIHSDEEDGIKGALKKSKQTDLPSSRRPKNQETHGRSQKEKEEREARKVETILKDFSRHVESDPNARMMLEELEKETLTSSAFTTLLRDMKYKGAKEPKRLEILMAQFKDDKSEGGPAHGRVAPALSVRKLKERLGVPIRKRKPSRATARTKMDDVPEERVSKEEDTVADPRDFNEATREILRAVNVFLQQNHKNDSKVLFKEMDKSGDGLVSQAEFVQYF